jgi:hypothetical protein
MVAPEMVNRFSYLDELFEEVCVGVQLTQSQFDNAKRKYEAIGRWLSDPGSPLLVYGPDIYPQGSMSLGTTIRPWKGEEFDLDIVCQLHGCGDRLPLQVYTAVRDRLSAHGVYSGILEPKNRCLRINYAGDFHLDIIPACPDGALTWAAIKVPDCKLADWKSSNPLGYAKWFFDRCKDRAGLIEALEKRIRPLPSNVPSELKYPLQRAVQVLKRHRDSLFDGNPDAARSILLTTLAATCYGGQESLTLALDGIIDGILAIIAKTQGIPRIPNPTNPFENLAEGWNDKMYLQFVEYARSFREHLNKLMQGNGLDAVTKSLGSLVGRPVAEKAVRAQAQQVEHSRVTRSLRVEPGTGRLGVAAGITVARNNFFGA